MGVCNRRCKRRGCDGVVNTHLRLKAINIEECMILITDNINKDIKMTRYDLAYGFIPYLISEFNNGNIRQVNLLQEQFFQENTDNEENEFGWDDFRIEHEIISSTKSVGIYIFPEPQKMPEAKFGLLFFDFKNQEMNYYTLEKSIPAKDGADRWVIGFKPDLDSHLNYGYFDETPTLEKFLKHICNKYEIE